MENLLWLALALLGWLVFSVGLAVSPHPEELERQGLPALALWISVLGRLSFLRHQSAPGTLHLPLTAQPWWLEAMQPLPQTAPDGSGPPSVIVTRSLLSVAALLLLMTGCQSFAQLAQVARRIYDAASDAEDRAAAPETKKIARGCGIAARDAERAALAAQQALTDHAPGYGALKVAADAAEKQMHKVCDPLHIDGSSVPPPVPDLGAHAADLRAAPDLGSGAAAPAAHDMGAPRG